MQPDLSIEKKDYSGKWMALISLGIGIFMATLDSSIVNISLPTLVDALHTNLATIEWVVLAYSLVLASLILSVGRLGDMYEKKKIYMTGMALFAASSLACGLSPSVEWLIAFRAVQGLGATMMQAIGMAMVSEAFPPAERGRALGINGTIISVGVAIGPPIGGILIGLTGWRSIFLLNVPVGIVGLFLVSRFVKKSQPSQANQRFDLAGALILLVTLSAYALGMTLGQDFGFTSTMVLILLVGTLPGLGTFLLVERRSAQPMVDLSLFRNLLFSLSLLMAFLVFNVLSASFIMPFFLELAKGYSIEKVGLLMMVSPVTMGLIAPLAGALSDRFGSRGISLVGLVVIVVGAFSMSTIRADVTPLGFILRMAPFGLGLGLFQAPNNNAIMGSVPRHRLGIASGLLALSRTLGSASGLPLMGAIFASQVKISGNLLVASVTDATPQALAYGVSLTYLVAAFIIVAAALLAVLAFVVDSRRRRSAAAAPAGLETESSFNTPPPISEI